jgi:hypothetical protein
MLVCSGSVQETKRRQDSVGGRRKRVLSIKENLLRMLPAHHERCLFPKDESYSKAEKRPACMTLLRA